METNTQFIWNPETGITDIDVSWQQLAAPEIESIRIIWAEQRQRLEGTRQLIQFTEHLSREWAIETGIIENLYQIDRGITQTLIERGFHAEFLTHGSTNKPASYVINLLNDQQAALEGVFAFVKLERQLSTSYIKQLHDCLVQSQDNTEAKDPSGHLVTIPLIKGDWKRQPNYPMKNGVTFVYCPPEQVASEMDRLIDMHMAHTNDGVAPEVEAAWLHHRFSQIHPFQDGNGRVCRALVSMVLVRAGLFPLVVTRDDKDKYLDALEEADGGDLKPLVDLFVKLQRVQFIKATALSENLLSMGSDVASLIESLKLRAQRSKQTREEELRQVFGHAEALELETQDYLDTLTGSLREVLVTASPRGNGNAYVSRSTVENNHYFRAQIIENAKYHLNYFADTTAYRSWVALNLTWERQARLVFAFHSIGKPFAGALVCAPFLEFRDRDYDEEQAHFTVVPVTDEPFVFFYNENLPELQKRFRKWRDDVVAVTLRELGNSL